MGMESEETSKAEGTSIEDKPMDVAANASETDEKTEDVEATVEKKEECNTAAEGKKEEGKAKEEAMESEETSKGEGTSKEDVESQKNAAPDAEKENANPNTSTPDTPKAGKDKPMEDAAKAPETEDKTEAMEATVEKKEESETASEGKGVLKSTLNLLVKKIRGD